MTGRTITHDRLEDHDRVYLEKQRLAVSVILELAEDDMISDVLATELYIFRDHVDRALLLPGAAGEILPWRDAPAPRPVPALDPAENGKSPA